MKDHRDTTDQFYRYLINCLIRTELFSILNKSSNIFAEFLKEHDDNNSKIFKNNIHLPHSFFNIITSYLFKCFSAVTNENCVSDIGKILEEQVDSNGTHNFIKLKKLV